MVSVINIFLAPNRSAVPFSLNRRCAFESGLSSVSGPLAYLREWSQNALMNRCVSLTAGIGMTLACLFAHAQNLNDAVTSQLRDVGGQPCALLLAGDPAGVLGGGLYDICTRIVHDPPIAGDPVPSSNGVGVLSSTPRVSFATDRDQDEDGEELGRAQRGVFFSVGYESADRSASSFEDGYASDILRLDGGFDWAVGTNLTLGFAAGASEQNGDFASGGDFRLRTFGLTGFGSYWFGDGGAIDFYAGHARQSNDRVRRARFAARGPTAPYIVVSMPNADFHAKQFLFGAHYSHDWDWNNVTLGPRLGYEWIKTDLETYSEIDGSGLALTFHNDKGISSQFSGGLAGSAAFSPSFGSLVISGSVLCKYESNQDQRNVDVSFVDDRRARRFNYQTESPDRVFVDYFASATFLLPNGLQLFAVYRGIASHRFLDVSAGTVGFRKEF
jgi:uncharacterized protein YhjY with autotransporter beta-barrel domain